MKYLIVGCRSGCFRLPSLAGANIDLNPRDVNGDTPLVMAILNHPELIEFLINSGADVNSRNNALETPLHFTALRGNIEGVRLLIENGGDVDAKTSSLETPLQFAAKRNQFKVVKFFLEYGANLNAKNVTKKTSNELSLASMSYESFKTILDFCHHAPSLSYN